MVMIDVLKNHATEIGQQTMLVYEGNETTYAEFYEQAKSIAGYLQSKSFQKDEIIAILMDNSDQFPIVYFAIQMAGYIAMPINTKLATPEIAYIIDNSNAKAIIFDEYLEQLIEPIQHPFQLKLKTTELAQLSTAQLNYTEPEIHADDVAVVMYTSGTTGKSKGVMLTHGNIYETARNWSAPMELTSKDRLFICTPLFHCAGAHVFMVPTFLNGATFIIESSFSPKNIIQKLSETEATFFFGVPSMYTLILNSEVDDFDVSNLRLFGYGAAPMPYELVKRLKDAYPKVKVQNFYGQTENSPAATSLLDEDALTKIGSVGKALMNTQVQISDGEGGVLPNGYVGEIIVKGPQVMKGYLNNPDETAFALRDGWLYTGDLGRMDDEGYLYIVDRKKDMIIRNGENIYPIEIEEVLFQMPEIFEAAVIGLPHAVYGEVPKAYVRVKEGKTLSEQQILDYCVTQLAKYKLPYEIEFIDELPRNASGKVLKHALKKQGGFI